MCVTHKHSVFNIDITAQAWLPEIVVGEALRVLKIALFSFLRAPEAISTCSEGSEWLPGLPEIDFWYLEGISQEALVALEGLRDAVCPTLRIPLTIFSGLDGHIWAQTLPNTLASANPETCQNIEKTVVFTRFWQPWSFHSSS